MSLGFAAQYECGSCLKPRDQARFSDTALRKYDAAVAHARRFKEPLTHVRKPVCSLCKPTKTHEFECAKCDVRKNIDAFSRQQRKRGDDRECRDCVQEREDREPVFQDQVRENEIMDWLQNGTGSAGHIPSSTSFVASANMSRLQTTRGSSIIDALRSPEWEEDTKSLSHNPSALAGQSNVVDQMQRLAVQSDDGWMIGGSRQNGVMTETAWDTFDRTLIPHRGRRFGSPTSIASHENDSRFAKSGAVKMDAQTKAAIQLERRQRREQEEAEQAAYDFDSDDDDDNDGDDDPPY